MFVFDLVKRVKNTKPAVSKRHWPGGVDFLDEEGHTVGYLKQHWDKAGGYTGLTTVHEEEFHTEIEPY